jgi:hypothetical protein
MVMKGRKGRLTRDGCGRSSSIYALLAAYDRSHGGQIPQIFRVSLQLRLAPSVMRSAAENRSKTPDSGELHGFQ